MRHARQDTVSLTASRGRLHPDHCNGPHTEFSVLMCPCRRRYARLDTIQSDSSAEARAAISVNSTGAANTELAQAAAVIDMSMAGLQPPASGLEAAQAAEALGLITEDSDEGLSASAQLAEQVSQGLLKCGLGLAEVAKGSGGRH